MVTTVLAPAVRAIAVPRILPLLERRYVLPPKVAVGVSLPNNLDRLGHFDGAMVCGDDQALTRFGNFFQNVE